jgi:hypothetical protein
MEGEFPPHKFEDLADLVSSFLIYFLGVGPVEFAIGHFIGDGFGFYFLNIKLFEHVNVEH